MWLVQLKKPGYLIAFKFKYPPTASGYCFRAEQL